MPRLMHRYCLRAGIDPFTYFRTAYDAMLEARCLAEARRLAEGYAHQHDLNSLLGRDQTGLFNILDDSDDTPPDLSVVMYVGRDEVTSCYLVYMDYTNPEAFTPDLLPDLLEYEYAREDGGVDTIRKAAWDRVIADESQPLIESMFALSLELPGETPFYPYEVVMTRRSLVEENIPSREDRAHALALSLLAHEGISADGDFSPLAQQILPLLDEVVVAPATQSPGPNLRLRKDYEALVATARTLSEEEGL